MSKPYNNQTTTLTMRSSLNLSRHASLSQPNASPTKTLRLRSSLRHDSLPDVNFNMKQNGIVQDFSLNKKEVGEMQSFVQQVSLDPALIFRLIDYKMLAEQLKIENGEMIGKIELQKQHLHATKKRAEMLMRKDSQSLGCKIRKEQVCVQQEIKEYSNNIQQMQQSHKQNHNKSIQRIIYLNTKIKQVSNQAKIQIACLNQSLSKKKTQNQSLKKSINIFMKKNKKLIDKLYQLEENNRNIQRLIHRVSNKKAQISELVKTEQQKVVKAKEDQVKKNKSMLEMRAKSEKKLKKFVEEICKIVEKGEALDFNVFADQYIEKNPQVREKNQTSDTTPEDGPTRKYESEMEKMEVNNPLLKDIKGMSLKSVQFKHSVKQMQQKLERNMLLESEHFLQVKSIDEKIKQLEGSEEQANTFLQALREKIGKIEQQIKLVKVSATFI